MATTLGIALGFSDFFMVITTRWRVILFGIYPYEEQWRSALACAVVAVVIVLSSLPRMRGFGMLARTWGIGTTLDDNVASIDEIRREVGMVFQQFNLFPHLTVLENAPSRRCWCASPAVSTPRRPRCAIWKKSASRIRR